MDTSELRTRGQDLVDYFTWYFKHLDQRPPSTSVAKGYLQKLMPAKAPEKGASWEEVKKDLEAAIMPGMVHWQSPHFNAYVTVSTSAPGILGSIAHSAFQSCTLSWKACPAGTELEVLMMNWLADMLRLPQEFYFTETGQGGGVLQTSTSEAILMAILCARTSLIRMYQKQHPDWTQGQIVDQLVAYTSEEAHFSVVRGFTIALVRKRILPTDASGSLRGSALESAIHEDMEQGLIPFFVCATVGTTAIGANDNLSEIGPICKKHSLWLHVDAAYSGGACICPEFRHFLNGIEYAMSLNISLCKLLTVTWGSAAMWVRNCDLLSSAFNVHTDIKDHEEGITMPEYRHWGLNMSRDMRSLKVWFVLKMFGIEGLQRFIRKIVASGKQFESLVRADSRFEIVREMTLSVVCYRLKGPNSINKSLFKAINADHRIHITDSEVRGVYFLRFVASANTEPEDVTYAWSVIQDITKVITQGEANGTHFISKSLTPL